MSSSGDLSTQTNSNEILPIEDIIATLSTLLDHLSKVKQSIPEGSSSNNSTGNNIHNEFEKLRRDVLQIKESFQKLKKFEDDASGPIKNLECSLSDISSVVAQVSNDFFPDQQVRAKLSALKKDAMKLKLNSPIEDIIDTLSTLLDHLSQVKQSIPQGSSSSYSTGNNIHNEFEKLRRDVLQIKESFQKLKKFEDDASGPIKNLKCSLSDISSVVAQVSNDFFPDKQVRAKLSALKKDAMKLKLNFPTLPLKMSTEDSVVHRFSWSNSVVNELPSLHMNHHKFICSSVFTEFQEVFKSLDIRLKLCLLSFVLLPEDVVVKRRLLIDWWVGESLVDPPTTGVKTVEGIVDEILTELKVKGFIEPVKERRKLVADRFKMQPLVQCVIIRLAQEAGFFDNHFNGIPTVNSPRCNRAFLVKDEDGTLEKLFANSPNLDQEKLQTLFNVNEPLPDLRFEWFAKKNKDNIVEWFSRMKKLNVLYLGRWQSSGQYHNEGKISGEHHIEVQSTEFLKGLKNMKHLRLLSLQGISIINELPDSICKLTNLSILDLKACPNLEALPDGIASLKKLLRLDVSECYLLDGMPKGLASLSELLVLKGFVIGNSNSRSSCTLEDLIKLKKLSKLSINTSSKAFPTEKELNALRKLEALQKLAIAWGGNDTEEKNDALNSVSTMNPDSRREDSEAAKPKRAPSRHSSKLPEMPKLPTNLEKLELQCFPHRGTPDWLISRELKSLKKLYVRGGKLNNLRQMQEGNDMWTVEILRLKYLNKFSMAWNELQTSFPKLIFLENVECPNLVSCPCDEFGVWLKSNVSNTI